MEKKKMMMKKKKTTPTSTENHVHVEDEEVVAGEAKTTSYDTTLLIRIAKIMVFTAAFLVVPFIFLCNSTAFSSFQFPSFSISSSRQVKEPQGHKVKESHKVPYTLEQILENAAMRDDKGTVVITTVNEAWAANGSLLDLFLESFRIGNNTQRFLNHLVIITLDRPAYARCISLHPHCYALKIKGGHRNLSKEAFFMTNDYLDIVWRKIYFSYSVLKMGYNIIFTDVDIMWLRDPFERFFENVDFQIACDYFLGSSNDINNWPNSGFTYVRSNSRSINFYKFWYTSRVKYPGNRNQFVFNEIKYDPFIKKIGLEMRFLDTAYFGGFCEHSQDINLVITMHANCCTGLQNKIQSLRMVLNDWRNFKSSMAASPYWTFQNCSDLLPNLDQHDSPP